MTRGRDGGETDVQPTNGDFSHNQPMTTKTDTTTTEQTENCATCDAFTRRTFIKGAGASAAIAATGATSAAAQDTTTDEPAWNRAGPELAHAVHAKPVLRGRAGEGKAPRRGADDDALRAYENDSGEKDELGAVVDREDTENVITARADKLAFPDADAFPRGAMYDEIGDGDENAEVSALDPTHWSTSDATNGSISVSDPGRDVHSLRLSTRGGRRGDRLGHVRPLGVQRRDRLGRSQAVPPGRRQRERTLASGATVTVAVEDADGDRKEYRRARA